MSAVAENDPVFQRMGTLQYTVVVLCFFAILFDGIDTTAIGVVVPALAREWGTSPASFTPAFLATNVGAVVGYLACGPIAQRIGRRNLIIVSVIWFGIATIATAFASSLTVLWVLRFITALGLGGAVPTGIAQAADYAPPRYRDAMTVAAVTGLSAGAMLSGLLGASLIRHFGWASVFIVGGALPLIFAPALWIWLPEAPSAGAAAAPSPAPSSQSYVRLFMPEYLASTALLWAYAFLIFVTFYALVSWVPTLLISFGFSPTQAPLGVAALGIGGVIGNIILAAFAARFSARLVLIGAGIVGIAAIVCIAWVNMPSSLLLVTLAAIGAGLVASCVGQAALAVSIYARDLRTTGVGCSSALGRVGSIAGPAVGGLMLSLGLPAREIVLSACLPVLVAIGMLALLRLREKPG